jgi:hypothetical protein
MWRGCLRRRWQALRVRPHEAPSRAHADTHMKLCIQHRYTEKHNQTCTCNTVCSQEHFRLACGHAAGWGTWSNSAAHASIAVAQTQPQGLLVGACVAGDCVPRRLAHVIVANRLGLFDEDDYLMYHVMLGLVTCISAVNPPLDCPSIVPQMMQQSTGATKSRPCKRIEIHGGLERSRRCSQRGSSGGARSTCSA